MSKLHTQAGIIDEILQRIARTGDELDRTMSIQQDPEITLVALSVEVHLVKISTIALREQLLLSLSWSDSRSAENQWSIDILLFAMNTTLWDLLNLLDSYIKLLCSPPFFGRLSGNTLKAKTTELQTSLGLLREQKSVLQCIMGLFDVNTHETMQMLSHCRSMLRKMEKDSMQPSGSTKDSQQPLYVVHLVKPRDPSERRQLSNENLACLLSSHRLTRELQQEGVPMKNILDVHRKSGLKPFVIRDILRRWRTYANREGYKIMLGALARSGYDIVCVDMHLGQLYELNRAIFSNILTIVGSSNYDLVGMCISFTKLRAILCTEPGWAQQYAVVSRPPELYPVSIGNLDFLGEAVKAIGFKTYQEFVRLLTNAGLTRSSIKKQKLRPLPSPVDSLAYTSSKDILHAANMVMELWRANGFDTSKSSVVLKTWQGINKEFVKKMPLGFPTIGVHVYLRVLRRYSYTPTAEAITWLSSPHAYEGWVVRCDAFLIAAYNNEPISRPSPLVEALMWIRYFATWFNQKELLGYSKLLNTIEVPLQPHFALMERCDYSFVRVQAVRARLRESFSHDLVAEGYDWVWLMLNDFDIKVTLMDAAVVPEQFSELTPKERVNEIQKMHKKRGVMNMKYTWVQFALLGDVQ